MGIEMLKAIDPEAYKRFENGQCTSCPNMIKDVPFKDALSVKEHGLSGLCQACQDEVFKEPEDEVDGEQI